MRVCVYGAGAMGTSLGALLTKAGETVELVSRNREHVAALRDRGARLCGALSETVPVSALLPEEMTGLYDVVFLATKQKQNRGIAEFFDRFLKEDGALVTVQNGIPEAGLAEVIGGERVYGCALSWGAECTQAGEVRITSESGFHFSLGAYGGGMRLDELSKMLAKAGHVTVGNLTELRFAKLAINASFSTLSAISGLPFGCLAKKYKKYVLALMREVLAVARAAGCKRLPLNGHDLYRVFGGAFAGLLLPIAMKKYRDTRSGMLKDLERGKRCDIDFLSGAVVSAGARYGVATPVQEQATALVHDIENGLAEIAPESLRLLNV